MPAIDIKVPDIGDFDDVPVVEIFVQPGDVVAVEDPLMSRESDKATMDVPSPQAGKVVEVVVAVGDKVSEGSVIVKIEGESEATGDADGDSSAESDKKEADTSNKKEATTTETETSSSAKNAKPSRSSNGALTLPSPIDFGDAHASPSVRMMARELGVDLTKMKGSGDKGRITADDVKRQLAGGGAGAAPAGGGMGIPPIPAQDFSKFGEIEEKPFSRLKRLSGPHLHRAWLNVPHVTHTDEADITELDEYRRSLDAKAKPDGYRVTLLSFLLKASVACLKEFPEFNASLGPNSDTLILKKYYNIGVAVDTPDGLVVPIIKDLERKGIIEISKELGEVSARMREGKITPSDVQGGTFSISSLGGIGGTHFTPIVNAPEVAILGVVRSSMKPVWDGEEFKPRNMLPVCVSYNHRVIDGALAARFTRRMCEFLSDLRQLVL